MGKLGMIGHSFVCSPWLSAGVLVTGGRCLCDGVQPLALEGVPPPT